MVVRGHQNSPLCLAPRQSQIEGGSCGGPVLTQEVELSRRRFNQDAPPAEALLKQPRCGLGEAVKSTHLQEGRTLYGNRGTVGVREEGLQDGNAPRIAPERTPGSGRSKPLRLPAPPFMAVFA